MWRNNSLSIMLSILFAASLAGHALAGWMTHNEQERQHGEPEIRLIEFLASSELGETVFENWESEFLQMMFYIILTIFFYQKGSAESKKHDGTDDVEEDPLAHRNDPNVPGPVRSGGWRLVLYKHSLSLAFLLLFLVSFVGHAASGARKYERAATARLRRRRDVAVVSAKASIPVRILSKLAERVPLRACHRGSLHSASTVGLAGIEARARISCGHRQWVAAPCDGAPLGNAIGRSSCIKTTKPAVLSAERRLWLSSKSSSSRQHR